MTGKNSLTFDEAIRSTGPTAFTTLVKPAGSACNLHCRYCYYLDKSGMYGFAQPVMDGELLELYIRQYIEANDAETVTFVWHGGEPLLPGLDLYRRALALQQKYAKGKRIENTLQTNGILLDEEWCRFFADNNFLIGISIDGPKGIHDSFRLNKAGAPTFDKVAAAIDLLGKYRVEFNTLSVVSRASEGSGAEVYRFLKSVGSRYMQFLPAMEYVVRDAPDSPPRIVPPDTPGSFPAEWSVRAESYGDFLNDIFDEWVLADVGERFVQIFDATLANYYGVPPGVCTLSETCGEALLVEHNGDVYPCDHYVYPEFRLGNIREGNLRDFFRSKERFRFGLDKRNALPAECRRCGYHFACRGECPKHRFGTSPSGERNMPALCAGLKKYFGHVDPYMKYMTELLDIGQPSALVMPWAKRRRGVR